MPDAPAWRAAAAGARWLLQWRLEAARFPPLDGAGGGVLVLRLDALGDFIVWLPEARAMARHYRTLGRRTTLLANSAWSGLAHHAGFDAVAALDRRAFMQEPRTRWALIRDLRAARFACVVNPHHSRELAFDDTIVACCGAPERIGQTGDLCNITPAQRAAADRRYTRLVASASSPSEAARNRAFGAALGIPAPSTQDYRLVPDRAHAPGAPETPYFLVAPGASWSPRRWPASRFATLARRIAAHTGWTAVLCGNEADAAACATVQAGLGGLAVRNLCGRTSVEALGALVAGARLVLGNESGPVHLAAATGTPALCILGGGHFGRFLPSDGGAATAYVPMACFGCDWRCVHPERPDGAVPCVAAVSPDQAWEAVRRLLPATPASSSGTTP